MPLEPGASIGDYKVIALLGSGGMGQVYKVQNLLSNRIEAMKVLVPDLRSQSDLAERFLREMQVHASLVHPNIAAMHTALRLDNQLVMLMEFVEGTTLEDRLREGNLGVRECTEYARQILSALAYAHKQGVIHRDIKPANVMVTPDGTVKVMDFGLAAGVADKRLTRAGTVVGSLYYMAPEQVRGETCSPQTDIYSAGLTLYEMLTGVRGIHGDTEFALMNAQLTELPEPPTRLNPIIPASLSQTVLKAIAKSPADRFRSASEFRDALESAGKPPAVSTDLEPTRVITPPAAVEPTPAVSPPSASSPAVPIPAAARSRTPLVATLLIAALVAAGVVAYRSLSVPSSALPAATVAVVTPSPSAKATPEPTPVPASEPAKAAERPEKTTVAEKASAPKTTPPRSSTQPAPVSAPPVAPAVATPDPTPPPEEAEQPEPAITPAKRQAARDQIANLLSQLDAAYISQDFGKLAALWPSATPEARGRWANFYTQFRSVAFTFRLNGDPTVAGTGAAVRYHFERTKLKGPAERTLMVRMSRTGGSWMIDSINFAGPLAAAK